MMAALRQPTNASVTGFPSDVMKRAEAGSASIAVFGSMSASRHRRNTRRSVSMMGPSVCGSVTPGLRGAIIGDPSQKSPGNIKVLCALVARSASDEATRVVP
jgi:hypothetical protein